MGKALTHKKARAILREQLKKIDPAKNMDAYVRVVNRLEKFDRIAEAARPPKPEPVVEPTPIEDSEPQAKLISGHTASEWALMFCAENVVRGDGEKLSFRQNEWLLENFPGETFTFHPIELADSVAELRKLKAAQ